MKHIIIISFLVLTSNLFAQESNWIDSLSEKGTHVEKIENSENDETYYLTNKRDERYLDIYLHRHEVYTDSLIFSNKGGYLINSELGFNGVFNKDKNSIILTKPISNKKQLIYLFDLKTKKIIEPHACPVDSITRLTPLIFNHEDKLLLMSDFQNDFPTLCSYDFKNHEFTSLFTTDGEIEFVKEVTPNEHIIITNNKGGSELWIQNPLNKRLVKKFNGYIPNYKINCTDSIISFWYSNPNTPHQRINYNYRNHEMTPIESINDSILFEELTYLSDSIEIKGYLMYPKKAQQSQIPLLIFAHGGPNFHQPLSYIEFLEVIVENDVAVFVPNFRGSMGFGKTFYHMDDNKHFDVAPTDIKNGINHIIKRYNFINPNRKFITGISYGGYVIYSTLIKYPNLIQGAIIINGVYDYDNALKIMPKFWEPIRVEKNEEFGISKIDFSKNYTLNSKLKLIQTNTVIFQGEDDPLISSSKLESDIKKTGNMYLKTVIVKACGHDLYRNPEASKLMTETILEVINEKHAW